MDRKKFDQWMMGLIPERVEVIEGARCVSVNRADEGFALDYTQNGETKTVTADFVVGADGANSIVRRSLLHNDSFRKYVAIQEWHEGFSLRPTYNCYFDKGITDCYAWGISKDNHFLLGGAFPVQGARDRFEKLKQKLASHGYRFGEPVKKEACLVLRPRIFSRRCLGDNGAFLIGEAAGLISPSLEGISYALNSAVALAEAFKSSTSRPNVDYAAKMGGLRLDLLMRHVKSLFYYSPFARRIVMKSGIKSIQVIP
jgi:flavin-dependent dehydrogenase